ncbi:MAG: hypothetical protein U0793_25605 [Gemmataceae bacterium]
MKATLATIGALLPLACLVPSASAQGCNPCYVCAPALCVPLPVGPSPCNTPGFYIAYPDGRCYPTVYGPNYYLRPPGLPFQGILPGDIGKAVTAGRPMSGPGAPPGMPPMMAGPGMPGMPGMPPGMVPMPPMPQMENLEGLSMAYYGRPKGAAQVVFPSHPNVRSPRDFFMWRETMEDRAERELRPRLIP